MIDFEQKGTSGLAEHSGPPVPLALPFDKERPPISSYVRETESMVIEPDVRRDLVALAARAGVSSPVVLLAALNTLLFRYSGQDDIILCTSLERQHPGEPWRPFLLRTRIAEGSSALDLIGQVAANVKEAVQNRNDASRTGRDASRRTSGEPRVFNTAFLFLDSDVREKRGRPSDCVKGSFADDLVECALVFCASEEKDSLAVQCEYDAELFEAATVGRLLGHFRNVLSGMVSNPETRLSILPLLTHDEIRQMLAERSGAQEEHRQEECVHRIFEKQADRDPDSVALVFEEERLTYRELNARANRLARHLRRLGVGPEVVVGLYVERSLEMVVGLLGILKAGGAYLPLDPAYPRDRLGFMLEDAQVPVLLTKGRLLPSFPQHGARVVRLDEDWPVFAGEDAGNLADGAAPHNLAYLIYTSGSTGKPKGVMVEHRNVSNFFTGMDACVGLNARGTWLAVTSLSFDISVLEIFWTLSRGFRVVIAPGDDRKREAAIAAGQSARRSIDFSLSYFLADRDENPADKHRLLIEGAKFADKNGFVAVWTPERHFHQPGGLDPSPAMTSAAVAMVTQRVQIRSDSIAVPMQVPIRVVEEWSVVDNLSNGRMAVSFVLGSMVEDWAFRPESYARHKDGMLRQMDLVRKLWRGDTVLFPGPFGQEVPVRIWPRPIQPELPVWLTTTGNPESYRLAGQMGAFVVTHLLGQPLEEVAEMIAVYRKARQEAGHQDRGRVTLMLHAFVGDSLQAVKETVRKPLTEYLRSSTDLIKQYSWAFSAFKNQSRSGDRIDASALSEEDKDALLSFAFERYFETSGLFGTSDSCLAMVERLGASDIDEIACLIDFGVDANVVLGNLRHLSALRDRVNRTSDVSVNGSSIPSLIRRHGVTYFQCTPSMASMLMLDEETKSAFGGLKKLLIGGEAFPAALAAELRKVVSGDIVNMYGPTETTIWSTTYKLRDEKQNIPIGRPIANTTIHILDENLQPVPTGVPGELMIGGAGVVRGYLNRADLTAERFIPNPFSENPKSRLYRTGDLARYLPDGNVEFMGRMDHQVKIRGYRIELDEIEALLNDHPAVYESVVIAREETPGRKMLVAYVIPREGVSLKLSELCDYLRGKLPDYMVPAHVVALKEFPRTPNKKIDRKALPPPEKDQLERRAGFDPPNTDIEEALATIWAEALGLGEVGRNENFFALGGDSLTACIIILNIRQTCRMDLPLLIMFQAPTVAALAEKLEEAFRKQAESESGIMASPDARQQAMADKTEAAFIPKPDAARSQFEKGFRPPESEIEKKIAVIWSDVLALEQIGIHDNFFYLGGNSIKALQVVFKIQKEFGVVVPLPALFNAPTIAELSIKVDAQSSKKGTKPGQLNKTAETLEKLKPGPKEEKTAERQRFELMDKEEGIDTSKLPVAPRNDATLIPLSFTQSRFWFLQQLDPENPVYNIAVAFRVTGRLNVHILVESINAIVGRHEILRTTFPNIDGIPHQIVNPFVPLDVPVVDLTNSQESLKEGELTHILRKEARKPFKTDGDSFLRIKLFRLKPDEHVLSIVTHHLVADGWSIRILTKELGECYRALQKGVQPSLPELPIQYPDYAFWEQGPIASKELDKHVSYWKKKLHGAPLVLDVPGDFQRPPVETFCGAACPIEVPKELTHKLRMLSQQQGVTIYITLLAAFQTLLHRYSRPEDLLVGTAVANINRPEIQNLIGSFSNNIVLRAQFHDNPSFLELLKQVRETVLEALEHQGLPFEKLLKEIQPDRDLSHNPLFQVALIFHQSTLERHLRFGDLKFERIPVDLGASRFDLTLEVDDDRERLIGFLEYKNDLFKRETIERMVNHLLQLLESVAKSPERKTSELNILTDQEKKFLLEEQNNTFRIYPKEVCIHRLFEEKVKEVPDKIAVEFESKTLTYRELNEKANRIANHLVQLGATPEDLVGVCVERSLDMVVGLLGILKAGCAYVPMDPSFPAERLKYMLDDAEISVLITQDDLAEKYSGFKGAVVRLDGDRDKIDLERTENLRREVNSGNLAYVIYTSGSTGQPKGVQITHQAVVNLLLSMREKPGLTERDRLVSVTTICFDISVLEIFLPLVTGARTIIASGTVASDGRMLLKLLKDSKATIMQATPSAWRLLIEAGWEDTPQLTALCGGETLSMDLAIQILKHAKELWNMYGPTETTIWSSVKKIEPGEDQVLIGPPIANTQFYILDNEQNAVPVGVPGELLIGGDGLARGYLNRPDLTRERFIENPFLLSGSSRLYRTGDLARLRNGGDVEFLGRLDHQVKIRGFRIELGEIEAALVRHPAVREGVVLAREDVPGDKRLVAYIVPDGGQTPSVSVLRDYLREKLPEYMVPSAFVVLEELPLTPNGKIDRRSLPSPASLRPELESAYVAPRTEIERTITSIWRAVLHLEKIGIYDNFFEMGGHSLLATQVISRINKACGVDLPLRSFFENPTIAGLSQVKGKLKDGGTAFPVPPIVPISRESRRQKLST